MDLGQIMGGPDTLLIQIKYLVFFICMISLKNKPAAQAAGADPSRWSSTNRQNPRIQQNCRNFWTSNGI